MASRWGLFLLGLGIGAVPAVANAEDAALAANEHSLRSQISDPVGCDSANDQGRLIDFGANGGTNSVGNYDQDFYGVFAAASDCLGERVRMKLEGAAVEIRDSGGKSQQYLVGLSGAFSPKDGLVLGLGAYAGYEDIYFNSDQTIVGVAATYQATKTLRKESGRSSYLILEGRPEYAVRNAVSTPQFGQSRTSNFVNYVGLGYVGPLGDTMLWRGRIGHRYIDTDLPTNSIGSATLGFGQENSRGGFRWLIDAVYSHGNGNYDQYMLQLTVRPGK